MTEMTEPKPSFRWTERRVARLVTILASAAVVAADVALFFVYRQTAAVFPPPWRTVIPVGIGGVFLFAAGRLRRQIRLFQQDR
ncbi:MAG TPA: hypothetical protein VK123_02570 [Candidatus Limnocylindrales bacterium]|nr:hypothetical protein [Candidatus Limnocylindrales bacterium]